MSEQTLPQNKRSFSTGYKVWLMVLLVMIYASNFIDRIIVAIAGPAIKAELGLSDFQLGILGGLAFAIFYSVLGIPIARLAERYSRVVIISVSTIIWSGATALCGLAQNYGQLLLMRIGVGVGEAGCAPAAHSLLADHFPPHRRATAIAIFTLGIPLGALLGAFVVGWLVQTQGWRSAFLWMGIPGVVLGLVAWLTLREPPRGMSDPEGAVRGEVPPLKAVIARVASRPAFWHVLAGTCLGGFGNFGINLFVPVYLTRTFEMGMLQAGMVFGILSGFGGILGNSLGGWLSDRGAQRDVRWYAWVPAIGFLLAGPAYMIAFSQATVPATVVAMLAMSLLVFLWSGPTFAMTHAMVEPRMRASVSALVLMAAALVGQGLGPMFMGLASDMFAASHFAGDYALACPGGVPMADADAAAAAACREASAVGVRHGILLMSLAYTWAAVHFYLASRSLKRDMAA